MRSPIPVHVAVPRRSFPTQAPDDCLGAKPRNQVTPYHGGRSTEQSTNDGGRGEVAPLGDPYRTVSDLNLIRRAVRNRWPIPTDKAPVIVERLIQIVEKRTVDVPAGEGAFSSDYHADANAIKAAGILKGMVDTNQADEHLEDKNRRLDEGKPTERLAGSISDAEVVAFFVAQGIPEKLPAALFERWKAGEFA